jgi:hypothetical protein
MSLKGFYRNGGTKPLGLPAHPAKPTPNDAATVFKRWMSVSLRPGNDLTRNIRREGLSREYLRGDDESGGDANENTETKVQIERTSTRTDCRAEEAVSMVFGLENFGVYV